MTAPSNLIHLRYGVTYRAQAGRRIVLGQYLGMETLHGDRAILLRNGNSTESIDVGEVTSIYPVAA